MTVTAGESTTCATASDHTTWCWGANRGTIGNGGTQAFYRTPQQVVTALHFTRVELISEHLCAGTGRP